MSDFAADPGDVTVILDVLMDIRRVTTEILRLLTEEDDEEGYEEDA
jgi:hypothetical protein